MKKIVILMMFILVISGCSSNTTDVQEEDMNEATENVVVEKVEEVTESIEEAVTEEVVTEEEAKVEESMEEEAMEEEAMEEEAMEEEAMEEEATEDMDSDEMVYTAETLAEFNGKDGNRAYIAIEGVVYDVTDNPLWREGLHQGRFEAGQDLTEEMKGAPHGLTKLALVEEVGTYQD